MPMNNCSNSHPVVGHMALVADDDPMILKLLRDRLEKMGFQVVTAKHGGEAVTLAAQSQFSVIITDIEMPVLNGLKVAKTIRSQGKHMAGIPIVAFTARGDLDACEVTDAGIDIVFQKATNLSAFWQLMWDVLASAPPLAMSETSRCGHVS